MFDVGDYIFCNCESNCKIEGRIISINDNTSFYYVDSNGNSEIIRFGNAVLMAPKTKKSKIINNPGERICLK